MTGAFLLIYSALVPIILAFSYLVMNLGVILVVFSCLVMSALA